MFFPYELFLATTKAASRESRYKNPFWDGDSDGNMFTGLQVRHVRVILMRQPSAITSAASVSK
jgi:hypothetical protein